MTTTTIPTILSQVAEIVSSSSTQAKCLYVGSTRIDLKFRRAEVEARSLVVCFHGAIDRESRPIPSFQVFPKGVERSAHCISIADPTLSSLDGFSLSWYMGHDGFRTQEVLPEIISAFSSLLNCSRTIYFGTSGGAFSALKLSRDDPTSVAVVANPQTNVANYYPGHVERYLKNCWSGISNVGELPVDVCTDVCKLYSSGFENSIIYLQNSTDPFHIHNHLAPFISNITPSRSNNFILEVGTWGRVGHAFSINALSRWIDAAIGSSDTTSGCIRSQYVLRQHDAELQDETGKREQVLGFTEADIAFAERLKRLEIGRI